MTSFYKFQRCNKENFILIRRHNNDESNCYTKCNDQCNGNGMYQEKNKIQCRLLSIIDATLHENLNLFQNIFREARKPFK